MDENRTSESPPQSKNKIDFSKIKVKSIAIGLVVLVIILTAIFGVYRLTLGGSDTPDGAIGASYVESQKGNYAEAQKILEAAIKKDPDNPALLSSMINNISLEGNQTGQEAEALNKSQLYIDQAQKAAPDNPDILLAIGYAYETAGEYDKALEYYNKTIEQNPKSSNAFFSRGHVNDFLGNREVAYKDYKKAYDLDPNNPRVLMMRGNAFLRINKTQEAFDSFMSAANQPGISAQNKAEALAGASLIRSSQNGFTYVEEATRLSQEAVDADPTFSPALSALAFNTFLTGTIEDAIEIDKRAIAANPRIARNYFLLASFYRANNDFGNAISYFKEAIDKVDNDNTILIPQEKKTTKGIYTYELAKTYSKSGLNVDPLPFVKEALVLNPSLRQSIASDVTAGFFDELSTNSEFRLIAGI